LEAENGSIQLLKLGGKAWDVQSWSAAVRSQRFVVGAALAFFVVQGALLLAAPNQPVSSLLSNLIQVATAALAAVAAWQAGTRSEGFVRRFWRLQFAAVTIWVAAQSLATYYDSVLRRPTNEPWPSDILFFVWVAPAFLILLLDPNKDPEKKDWQQLLDFAQVGILASAAYFFLFEIPTHWQNRNIPIGELILITESGRDVLLIAAFAFRATSTRRGQERALYGRMALFYLAYAAGNFGYLYLQFYGGLRTGTIWDLCWSFPFVLATVLTATLPRLAPGEFETGPEAQRTESRGARVLLKVVPLVFPLAVLLMAAQIAEQRLGLAIVAVLASFGCSSASVLLSEQQQRKYLRELEEKNALLRSMFEGSGDSISVKDLEGRYLYINQTLARIYGTSPENILGKTAGNFNDRATARLLAEHDRLVLSSGQTKAFEYPAVTGQNLTFLTTKSPVRDSEGKIIGVITMSRDITEHRAMEERLRQSQKMEAIGTLAGGVAHDFNNILMVISGYSQVLIDALAKEPKLRSHVEQMQRAGERAASLTRQLLAFSRKQTTQPEPLNLNHVVTGMEKMLLRLIGENITITTKLAPELGAVNADAGQLEQVILNLAVNARDAMPQGGQLTLETKNLDFPAGEDNESDGHRLGPCVQLEVRDTGIGMEPSVRAHIFEPFFTTKPKGKGTGLGLSTVYGIVEQAGGQITFKTVLGEGTSFRILLPRIASRLSTQAPPEGTTDIYRGEETVLLVEDDAAVCELVRAVLTSHGYKVLTARHPEEAQSICADDSNGIELLLTDVIMPGMSGAELYNRVTAQNPSMKVLFMSGYIDDSVIRQGIQENEVAFLQKPFSPLSLAKKVREVLDGLRVS
jgi:PAS domain S-box-containing protein